MPLLLVLCLPAERDSNKRGTDIKKPQMRRGELHCLLSNELQELRRAHIARLPVIVKEQSAIHEGSHVTIRKQLVLCTTARQRIQ